jgi:glucose/arabinose dehydrogenase
VITYGREYYGPKIGTTAKEGMEQPVAHWVPSISPSGLAFWKGAAILACLSGQRLQRVALDGDAAGAQEALFAERAWRFRNVRPGPDGLLYFSTDEGLLGRVAPAR